MVWRSSGGHSWAILGSSWDHFGITLASTWEGLGEAWEGFGTGVWSKNNNKKVIGMTWEPVQNTYQASNNMSDLSADQHLAKNENPFFAFFILGPYYCLLARCGPGPILLFGVTAGSYTFTSQRPRTSIRDQEPILGCQEVILGPQQTDSLTGAHFIPFFILLQHCNLSPHHHICCSSQQPVYTSRGRWCRRPPAVFRPQK